MRALSSQRPRAQPMAQPKGGHFIFSSRWRNLWRNHKEVILFSGAEGAQPKRQFYYFRWPREQHMAQPSPGGLFGLSELWRGDCASCRSLDFRPWRTRTTRTSSSRHLLLRRMRRPQGGGGQLRHLLLLLLPPPPRSISFFSTSSSFSFSPPSRRGCAVQPAQRCFPAAGRAGL